MASQGLLPAHLELVERGEESLRPQADDLKKRCVCCEGGGREGGLGESLRPQAEDLKNRCVGQCVCVTGVGGL